MLSAGTTNCLAPCGNSTKGFLPATWAMADRASESKNENVCNVGAVSPPGRPPGYLVFLTSRDTRWQGFMALSTKPVFPFLCWPSLGACLSVASIEDRRIKSVCGVIFRACDVAFFSADSNAPFPPWGCILCSPPMNRFLFGFWPFFRRRLSIPTLNVPYSRYLFGRETQLISQVHHESYKAT